MADDRPTTAAAGGDAWAWSGGYEPYVPQSMSISSRRESHTLSDIFNELGHLMDDCEGAKANVAGTMETPSPRALDNARGEFKWAAAGRGGTGAHSSDKHGAENAAMETAGASKGAAMLLPRFLRSDSLASDSTRNPMSPLADIDDKDHKVLKQFVEMAESFSLPDASSSMLCERADGDYRETLMDGDYEPHEPHGQHAQVARCPVPVVQYCTEQMPPPTHCVQLEAGAVIKQDSSDECVIDVVGTASPAPMPPAAAAFDQWHLAVDAGADRSSSSADCGDKASRRRAKNNEACRRSRAKRKLLRQRALEEKRELEMKNKLLRREIELLSRQRNHLRQQVTMGYRRGE